MKTFLEQSNGEDLAVKPVRLEVQRCQHDLEACRVRIWELEQAETLLAGENRILEMVARGSSLAPILDALCRLVEEVARDSLATILLLDQERNRLWHAAAPSLPSGYTEGMGGIVIGPSVGSCGTAAYRRAPVIVCDIATDPLWADYRDVALAHGLRASWSTPIFSSVGELLGTFAILSREPRSPTAQHCRITEQITHLASIAIERKRTETALQESEERFRRMADAIPEVIWFTALEPEKVLYVSPSFERIWGVPVTELYANPRLWTEMIHPDDRERVTRTISSWIAGQPVGYHLMEYRIVQPGGATRWIHERGVLRVNEQGKPCLASGISTDITDRKQADEELRRSEAYLAEAQRLSRTGSFGWNVSRGELIWSKETFCILGYDRAAKPSMDLLFKRVHPEDIARVQRTMDRARHDQKGFDLEHRLQMPDSSIKHLQVVAHPSTNESGEVEFVGAVMDITERKNSQEALRAAKSRFEGILEIAEDAIISVDSGQRIVLFNQGAEKVFGYAQAEVIGQPLDLLLPERFVHAHRGHVEAFSGSAEASRSMGQRREVFGRRKGGSEFPAEASISKLDLGGEKLFAVILRDITQRKRAAEALHASEHLARGQLAALTHTLDALVQESDPDRLLEHVLRTIVGQTGSHSVSVWERNDGGGWLALVASIEDNQFRTGEDGDPGAARRPILGPSHPVWSEVFRTGQYAVMEDAGQLCARARVGSNPNAVWHPVMDDGHSDPDMLQLKKQLEEQGVRSILFVPILIAGQVAGIIGVRFKENRTFRREEIELARALAHQAMLAIQLMRLSRQSRQAAVIAERNRMARDIHDTLAQGFTGVIVQLEAAQEAMSQNLASQASGHLDCAGDLAREGLREARRSVRALRPLALEGQSLCEALESLIRRMTASTMVRTEFTVQGEPQELPPEWEENLLRVGQEAVTNVLRHAQAAEFKVGLVFQPREICLNLRDNGRGFDPAGKYDGFGLQGMRERVEEMGGQLTIQSTVGEGTVISIALPLPNTREPT